jgi:hypothetical protein
MKNFICLLATGLIFAIFVNGANANDHDWELARDRDGIAVYTKPVAGSKFKAVKSTMTVQATLSELVALVRDSAACSEWADLCKKAEVVESVSETELYVYTYNDLPWPVSDRDAIAHIIWAQEPEHGTVTMTASLVDGNTPSTKVPEVRKAIRLKYGKTSWEFKPLSAGRVAVTSRAHVDPEGATPAWLTNRLLVGSPYDTMLAMRKIIGTGRYRGAKFGFLSEP